MAATSPPTITAAPTPAPQRGDRSTFSTRVDAFVTWLISAVTQFAALGTNVYNNAVDAFSSATTATTQAANAAASATAAAAASAAALWVSGTTYSIGQCAISPANLATYRRKTNGAGTTDPASDGTNWMPLPIAGVVPVGALTAFDSDQTGNTVAGSSGEVYLKTGVIADTATYPNAPAAPWAALATATNTTSIANLFSLAYGAGVWLAGNSAGQYYRSTDGLVWGTANSLTGFAGTVTIVYANGIFVAVDGTNAVCAKSTDGTTWTYGTMPSSGAWRALAFGGTTWVSAKSGGTVIATSTDGLTWGAQTNSRTWTHPGIATIRGPLMAYGAGVFVLIDDTGCSTSPTGVTWNTRAGYTAVTSCSNICFGAGIFVVSQNDATNPIQTSTDGTAWTARPYGALNANKAVGFVGGSFVLMGSSTGITYTSANGTSWTTNNPGGFINTAATWITSNGTYYVAGGAAASDFSISYDVTHWQQVEKLTQALKQVAWSGSRYFTNRDNNQSSWSADGVTWLILPGAFGTQAYGAAYFNGLYCLSDSSNYLTSPDGWTWTSRTVPTYRAVSGLWVANGRLYSLNNSGNFSYSADGLTWTDTGAWPSSANWFGVTYGNSVYLAWTATTGIATSTNGLTWVARNAFPASILSIVFASGYFVGVDTSGNWYRSTDGISWTQMTLGYGVLSAAVAVVTDGTRVFAPGASGVATWSGSGATYYMRASATEFAAYPASAAAYGNGVIAGRTNSAAYYAATISATAKVLNDTNLKTYNATAGNQTNFYKRVA